MADAMFAEDDVYMKCGVILEGLHEAGAEQGDLFADERPGSKELLSAIDDLNARFGRAATTIASAGHRVRSHDTKHPIKSPAWTTRLAEIPLAK